MSEIATEIDDIWDRLDKIEGALGMIVKILEEEGHDLNMSGFS